MSRQDIFDNSVSLESQITEEDVIKAIITVFKTQHFPVLKQGLIDASGMKMDTTNYVNMVYDMFALGKPFDKRNQLIELAYNISQASQETESTMPPELSNCFTRPIGPDCGSTPTAGRYPPDSAPSSDAMSS